MGSWVPGGLLPSCLPLRVLSCPHSLGRLDCMVFRPPCSTGTAGLHLGRGLCGADGGGGAASGATMAPFCALPGSKRPLPLCIEPQPPRDHRAAPAKVVMLLPAQQEGLQLLLPGCPESGPRVREGRPCGGPAAFAGDQEPLGTGGPTLASDSLGFLPPPGRWCGSWLRGPLAEGRNCSQPWVVARPPGWKVPGCPGARKVPASWAGHVRGWVGGRCSGTLAGWEGHWPGHAGATTFAAVGARLLSEPARVPSSPSELGWPREMLACG